MIIFVIVEGETIDVFFSQKT